MRRFRTRRTWLRRPLHVLLSGTPLIGRTLSFLLRFALLRRCFSYSLLLIVFPHSWFARLITVMLLVHLILLLHLSWVAVT